MCVFFLYSEFECVCVCMRACVRACLPYMHTYTHTRAYNYSHPWNGCMCGLSPGYKVSGRLSVKLQSVDLMGRVFTVVDQPRLRG